MQQGPMTPPPMGQAGYGQPGYGQPPYGGYGQAPPAPGYGQPTIGMGQPGMMPGAPMGMPGGQPPKKSNTGLLIGIGGGAVAVIAAIVIVIALVSSGGSSHNDANSSPTPAASSPGGSGGSSSSPGAGGSGGGGSGGGGSNPWTGMQAASGSYDNSYEGTWNGTINGSSGSATAEVNLYPAIGTGLASYKIGSVTCYSKMTIFQTSSSAVALKEIWEFSDMSTYPECAVFNNSYEVLSLNNGTLHYTDYHNQGDTTAIYTGDLTKGA
jgi:hypothetical protein